MGRPWQVSRREALRAALAAGAWAAVGTGVAAAAPAPRASSMTVPFQLYFVGPPLNATAMKLIQDFVDATFNARHKGIRAVFVPPYNESGVVASILGGESFPWVVSSCCSDWAVILPFLQPLDSYLRQDNIDMHIWSPGQLGRFRVGGRLYGLPEDAVTDVYLYRQDVLDELGLQYPEPGWTLQDAARLWERVSGAKGPNGSWRYGATCPWGQAGLPEGLPTALVGFGAQLMDASGTHCLMDSPEAIAMGEYWFPLVWEKVATNGDGWPNGAIFTGNLVFTTGAEPTILLPVERFGSAVKWDFITWPVYPKRPVGKLHDNFYGMVAQAPHKEIAWELLKWAAIETEWSRFYMKIALAPPALPGLFDEWLAILRQTVPLLRSKHIEYWTVAARNGWGVYDNEFFTYEPTQAAGIIGSVWPEIWQRRLSVAQGFKQITQQVNALEAAGPRIAAAFAAEEGREQRALQAVKVGPHTAYPQPSATGVGVPATSAPEWVVKRPGGSYTLLGDGWDVWATSDNCVFAGLPVTATEGEWWCRVTAVTNLTCPHLSQWAKVGIAAFGDLSDDTPYVSPHVTGAHQIEWQYRIIPGLYPGGAAGLLPSGAKNLMRDHTKPAANYLLQPLWLKISRQGEFWTPWASLDGKTWTQLNPPAAVRMAGCWVGIFACAHNGSFGNKGYIRATIDNLSFVPTHLVQLGQTGVPPAAGPLPKDWATMAPAGA